MDSLGQVGQVHVTVGAKDPASSRDLCALEGAKGDACPNAIELGLAIGDK